MDDRLTRAMDTFVAIANDLVDRGIPEHLALAHVRDVVDIARGGWEPGIAPHRSDI